MAELAPWATAETAPWETPDLSAATRPAEGATESVNATAHPEGLAPQVTGLTPTLGEMGAGALGAGANAVYSALEAVPFLGKKLGEGIAYGVGGDPTVLAAHAERARQTFDKDTQDDMERFWSYMPGGGTPAARKFASGVGEAATDVGTMGAIPIAQSAVSSIPDEAARQSVQEATGDVGRGLSALPLLGVPAAARGGARLVSRAGEAYERAVAPAPEPPLPTMPQKASASSSAVTPEQLRAGSNPIPAPNTGEPVAPATQAVQKPHLQPRAGESAQAAAVRQGLAPAAPEALTAVAPAPGRLFHPPQEDGPQYAAPVSAAGQAERQAQLDNLSQLSGGVMTADRRGAVTGDWQQTGNEHQTSLMPGEPGDVLRTQIASEHDALQAATQNVHESVGSAALNSVDRDTLEQRGSVVRGAVQAIDDHLTGAANGLYASARAALGDNPLRAMPRVSAILNDASHDTNPTAASLRQAAATKMRQLWSVGDTRGNVVTAPGTVGAAERFHEFLNESYHNDSAGLVRKLKNATDLDVAEAAGGNDMFQTARNVIQHRETMLEPDAVNALRRPKDRNHIEHEVDLDKVMDHVVGQPREQFEHFMNVLRAGAQLGDGRLAPQMAAAVREIQGHIISRLYSAARGEGGQWKANDFYKTANRFSTNLPAAFRDNPSVLANLQTINRAGNILKMDKSYPGAVAQAAKVGLLPRLAERGIKGAGALVTGGSLLHGNVVAAGAAHLGAKVLERGAEKFVKGSQARTARESLIPRGAQRGSVGVAPQRDAVEHQSRAFVDGAILHRYTIPNSGGSMNVVERPELGVRQVQTSSVVNKGQGWGTRMLQRAADDAHEKGQVLRSDERVSDGQAGAYSNLAKLGYKVTKKDSDHVGGEYKAVGDHVFEVGPRGGKVPESQRGSVRVMHESAEPKGGTGEPDARLNIGLHVGDPNNGGRVMSPGEAIAAIRATGRDVGKTSVVQSNTEPTLVADLSKSMAPDELHALSAKLQQGAIAQRYSDGSGILEGPHAKDWGGEYAPDYFRMHDGRTASEHVANRIHPNTTVNNPERSAFPGIYDEPKEIMSRVRTVPEDPIMKELFGVTRKDLHDVAVSRGDVAPKEVPGVVTGKRARGSTVAKSVTTDVNAERIRNVIAAFKAHDESAYHGMVGWYVMDPLHRAISRVLGRGKAADAAYSRLNTLMGMASPGSDVATEINRGTAANMMASQGKFNKFLRQGGRPAGAPGKPAELANVSGHPYHSTAQAQPMARYLETGVGAQAPKTSMYIAASEPTKSAAYQNKVLVGDSHFSRGVGLSDVRTAKDFSGSIVGPEIADIHPWYHEKVAKPSGLPATSAQAVQWGALSHETGVETAVGAPKLELFAQAVKKAAARLGVTPKEALEMIIKGIAHAG